MKDAMLREFQEEIARLKAALEDAGEGGTMESYVDEQGQLQQRYVQEQVVENVVEVEKEVEKVVEVERIVEVEKVVEVEKIREIERVVEVEKEVERVVEVEVDKEVEYIVEVEKEVGVDHAEVERIQQQMVRARARGGGGEGPGRGWWVGWWAMGGGGAARPKVEAVLRAREMRVEQRGAKPSPPLCCAAGRRMGWGRRAGS